MRPAFTRCAFPARLLAAALMLGVTPGAWAVYFTFDYSFDAAGSNFFLPGSAARTTLETVGDYFAARINDNLTAIDSNGGNNFTARFTNPDTGVSGQTLPGLDLAAGEILIIPGARELGGTTLARAGPGSFEATGTAQFTDNATTRGQGTVDDVQNFINNQTGEITESAVDFALWGGTLSFDITTGWHFGLGTPGSGFDFLSVAFHEFAHVLGIGTADSWSNLVSGSDFTGSASVAEFGGNVPLQAGGDHWFGTQNQLGNTMSTVADGPESYLTGVGDPASASLNPFFPGGVRRLFTDLDLAALEDVGWEISNPPVVVPLPAGVWLLLSGVALLATRRRAVPRC